MSKESCTCKHCVGACTNHPGWMTPGQVERMAEFLKLTPQELFDQYLVADTYYDRFDGSTLVLRPAQAHDTPGTAIQGWKHPGRCTFLGDDNRCKVHQVKPKECADYLHTNKPWDSYANHHHVGDTWAYPGAQIEVSQLLAAKTAT